jgi:hypothetical protein
MRTTVIFLLLIIAQFACSQTAPFPPVEQWKGALVTNDTTTLLSLYSTNPPARFIGGDRKPAADISLETDFWQKLATTGMSEVEVTEAGAQDQDALHVLKLQISMRVKTPEGLRTRYVVEQQAWQQQADTWRIVAATHSELLKMRQPAKLNPNLYSKDADAKIEIHDAVTKAAKDHKRVILVFGGNWCYDCHVLDTAFHEQDVAPLVDKNFDVVHVDIGDDGKKNADLVTLYKIPIDKGVPALAILGPDGKLIYSQQQGEFQAARSMDPDDVVAFLNKWKP